MQNALVLVQLLLLNLLIIFGHVYLNEPTTQIVEVTKVYKRQAQNQIKTPEKLAESTESEQAATTTNDPTEFIASETATGTNLYENIELSMNKTNITSLRPPDPYPVYTYNYAAIQKPYPTQDDDDCVMGPDSDQMSQDHFSTQLTNGCRYDRQTKPRTHGPLQVTMQVDIRHIEAMEQLQFKMHMLLQYRYLDTRLDYTEISPRRGIMVGEDKLRDKIWIPHIILSNERDTSIMGLEGKDVFVSISPRGEVIYSYRMTAMIYCWMDLKKFPFDEQICDMHFKSWTYNASDLMLHWESDDPVKVAGQLHLTEFKLTDHWTNSSTVPASFSRGVFIGEYSNLVFKFQISREIGFYILDYFIPSIMLVAISWVTFWLQADNAAPRITLGTSTMLSFITLASGQGKHLPKVSYIKASEIWFIGCSMFIFASIAEFAFVNIIWRRKKKVELKKVNSKYILKSTLTPKLARKELMKSNSMQNLHRANSCTSLDGSGNKSPMSNGSGYNNYLTVHSFPRYAIPKITMQSDEDLLQSKYNNFSVTMPESPEPSTDGLKMWTTMTPQEIAIWIDKRSRFVFPIAFMVFNIFYWSFVYAL